MLKILVSYIYQALNLEVSHQVKKNLLRRQNYSPVSRLTRARNSLYISLLGILLGSAASATDITLDQAYNAALAKSVDTKLSDVRTNQIDTRIDQIKSRFLPRLTGDLSHTRSQEESRNSDVNDDRLIRGGLTQAKVSLLQSIYKGGADESELTLAQFDKDIEQLKRTDLQAQVYAQIARFYFNCLASAQDVEDLNRTIKLAKDRMKEIQSRARIGKSRDIEFTATKAQLATLEAQLIGAIGSKDLAYETFFYETGLNRNSNLAKTLETPPHPGSLEQHLVAVKSGLDFRILQLQIERAKARIESVRTGHSPTVDLAGNLYLKREGSQKDNKWDLTLSLGVPIYSGGLIASSVEFEAKKYAEAQLELDRYKERSEIAVRNAYTKLVSILDQVKAYDSALKSSDQNYKEQEKNYRFGQASNLDVIQALNSLQDNRRTLERTKYAAFSAWADLIAETGKAPEPSSISNRNGAKP